MTIPLLGVHSSGVKMTYWRRFAGFSSSQRHCTPSEWDLDLWVFAQIREAIGCIGGLGVIARVLEGMVRVSIVQDDDGEGLLRILAGVHAYTDVPDQLAELVGSLETLKHNILASA